MVFKTEICRYVYRGSQKWEQEVALQTLYIRKNKKANE